MSFTNPDAEIFQCIRIRMKRQSILPGKSLLKKERNIRHSTCRIIS
ncbi:MAG: hypothetical protein BWY31_04681 [Lentisphaerae bacterium ADurb.Bin242]|nr:MAG: hypothetical protein BWY31_04681 [Lentisphaerae bacterium ADurb.Bin242]